MTKIKLTHIMRYMGWFILVGYCLVNFGGASTLMPFPPPVDGMRSLRYDAQCSQTLVEMNRLGLLKLANQNDVEELLKHQKKTGSSLAQILMDPQWSRLLGLSSSQFKATWYVSNPFTMLPRDLQAMIRQRKEPFQSRAHVWEWCRARNLPARWREALHVALIETTPLNLWRASQGKRPYAKNGQYIEPIVVDHGHGDIEIKDGHIATDPKVIPTNTNLILLVRIKGEYKLVRVKAADIGAAVRGRHVDLPIQMSIPKKPFPHFRLPKEYISNPTVHILTPIPRVNRGQKA